MGGISKDTLRMLILLVFYLIFLVVGAAIFSAIEGRQEHEQIVELRSLRQRFLQDHESCLTDAELEAFIAEVVKAADRGVSAVNNVTMVPNWSFGQSLFFAGTVITTIGYGHVAPLSNGGKGFCIAFALIGIPLTLIMFTAVVHRLLIPTNKLLDYMKSRIGHLYSEFKVRLFHLSVVILIILVFMFIIPSVIFSVIEPEWDFFSAFYYCFISLTTIGLGDYIPGDHPVEYAAVRPIYKVAITGYLLIGLTFMMLLLAVLYEIPELNIGLHFYLKDTSGESEETVKLCSGGDKGPKYTEQKDENMPSYQQSEPVDLNEETNLTSH